LDQANLFLFKPGSSQIGKTRLAAKEGLFPNYQKLGGNFGSLKIRKKDFHKGLNSILLIGGPSQFDRRFMDCHHLKQKF